MTLMTFSLPILLIFNPSASTVQNVLMNAVALIALQIIPKKTFYGGLEFCVVKFNPYICHVVMLILRQILTSNNNEHF